MKIDDILSKNYGEGKNPRITVNFNKLVRTKEYESERVEASYEIDVLPGEDLVMETLKAQAILEYTMYQELLYKRQITQEDFTLRKTELDEALTAMEEKLKNLRGQ